MEREASSSGCHNLKPPEDSTTMIPPGKMEQQYCNTQCRINVLTQDGLLFVRVYVSPTRSNSKALGTKEVQLDRTTGGENQEQNSKQKAIERQNATEEQ